MALSIDAGLVAQITDTATKAATAAVRQWVRDTTTNAKYTTQPAQATADSSGNAALQVGPVPDGRRWMVRAITIGGLYWSTSAAGTAVACVSAAQPNADVGLPLINVQDEAVTLPLVAFYGRGEFPVLQGQSLWLMVAGGTSGQVYSARVTVVDEPAG